MNTALTSIRITLPDDLLQQLDAEATAAGQPLNAIIAERLTVFRSLSPAERHLIFGQVDLAELDTLLGGLPIKDARDLVNRIRRATTVSLGGVKLDLPKPIIERIKEKAKRHDQSYSQEVQQVVLRVLEQIEV